MRAFLQVGLALQRQRSLGILPDTPLLVVLPLQQVVEIAKTERFRAGFPQPLMRLAQAEPATSIWMHCKRASSVVSALSLQVAILKVEQFLERSYISAALEQSILLQEEEPESLSLLMRREKSGILRTPCSVFFMGVWGM